MRDKKGQAAMEFLMTYGWAILVVLVAIGALAYFGVLNPSNFLPDSCQIAPGISCDNFQIQENGAVSTIILRNGLGKDMHNVNVALTGCPLTTPNQNVTDGSQATFTTTCTASGAAGARYKGDINVTYLADGLTRTKVGEITTKVE